MLAIRTLLAVTFILLMVFLITLVIFEPDFTLDDNYGVLITFAIIILILGPLWPGKQLNISKEEANNSNKKVLLFFTGAALYITLILLAVTKYVNGELSAQDIKQAPIFAIIISFVGTMIFSIIVGVKSKLTAGYTSLLKKRYPEQGEALAEQILHMGDPILKLRVKSAYTILLVTIIASVYVLIT